MTQLVCVSLIQVFFFLFLIIVYVCVHLITGKPTTQWILTRMSCAVNRRNAGNLAMGIQLYLQEFSLSFARMEYVMVFRLWPSMRALKYLLTYWRRGSPKHQMLLYMIVLAPAVCMHTAWTGNSCLNFTRGGGGLNFSGWGTTSNQCSNMYTILCNIKLALTNWSCNLWDDLSKCVNVFSETFTHACKRSSTHTRDHVTSLPT